MPIQRITCPECGAGLRSPGEGFTVGQVVQCPKCETQFEVEQPVSVKTAALSPSKTRALSKKTAKLAARDDDDDVPRKKKPKKKKRDDDEEDWSYKNSWIRYAVLGVLLVILVVLGYFLWKKKQKEKEDTAAPPPAAAVVRS